MKVVFGTDGSDHSHFAREFLLRYPLGSETEVHCCSVYSASHIITATSHPFLGPMIADQITQAVDDAREHAERASKEAAEAFPNSKAVVLEGDVAYALAKYSDDQHADLAVAGSRGQSTFETLLLGSVTRSLANDANLNLLVTRKKEFAAAEGLSVMFATDHSGFAEGVAAKLPSLMKGKFKSLEAVSVMDPESKDLLYAFPRAKKGENWPEMEKSMEEWLRQKTEEVAVRLHPLTEVVSSSVQYGHDRDKIVGHAEATGCDLIIMGAKGRTGLSRLLLGSVSHYVLNRAKCSVMIVRA
ncbi:MAG: universal stress protein [Armatimonadetes bacterium]|nr:universal stress protein [Armatimonadota bacterium]